MNDLMSGVGAIVNVGTSLPESIYDQQILHIDARNNSLLTLPDSLVYFNNSYLDLYLSGNSSLIGDSLIDGLNQDFVTPYYFH